MFAIFPAGTAQYHINADIIYALKTYTEVTQDMDFMLKMGAEMLFETAVFGKMSAIIHPRKIINSVLIV